MIRSTGAARRSSALAKPINRAAASFAYTSRPAASCAVIPSATPPNMAWSSERDSTSSRSARFRCVAAAMWFATIWASWSSSAVNSCGSA
jgi:hypothetical protein